MLKAMRKFGDWRGKTSRNGAFCWFFNQRLKI
jgi:hypothetical protein